MKVIVTGACGQDGSYMVEHILRYEEECEVFAIVKQDRQDSFISEIVDNRLKIIETNITNKQGMSDLIRSVKPDFFVNFAAISNPRVSKLIPAETFEINTVSIINILEILKERRPQCKFMNAGSVYEKNLNSPYSVSKFAAREMVNFYKNSCNMFALQPLLHHHESERRGPDFLSRTITKGVARILKEMNDGWETTPLFLGNIDEYRYWTHAEDIVDGLWKMLNQNLPIEYELCSDKMHTIRDFAEKCFEAAGFLKGRWEILGVNEVYLVENNPLPLIVKLNNLMPYMPNVSGDNTLAKSVLGWQERVPFDALVYRMMGKELTTKTSTI